jgi:hypothetical protein
MDNRGGLGLALTLLPYPVVNHGQTMGSTCARVTLRMLGWRVWAWRRPCADKANASKKNHAKDPDQRWKAFRAICKQAKSDLDLQTAHRDSGSWLRRASGRSDAWQPGDNNANDRQRLLTEHRQTVFLKVCRCLANMPVHMCAHRTFRTPSRVKIIFLVSWL